jgi:hypothetical protein
MKSFLLSLMLLLPALSFAQGLVFDADPSLPQNTTILRLGPDTIRDLARHEGESTLYHFVNPNYSVTMNVKDAPQEAQTAFSNMEKAMKSYVNLKSSNHVFFVCKAKTSRVDSFDLKVSSVDFCIDLVSHQIMNFLPRLITAQEIQNLMNDRAEDNSAVVNGSREPKASADGWKLDDFESASSAATR